MPARFLAFDLGASSVRVIVGEWTGEKFSLRELHRVKNAGVTISGQVEWDIQRIWSELRNGLANYVQVYGKEARSIGVDGWGVDFGLLDAEGKLLGNPVHYRDARTKGVPERLFRSIPELDLYSATGTRSMEINTIFQLRSMVEAARGELEEADTLLMVPELISYFLCGVAVAEWTEASTSGLTSSREVSWAYEIAERAGIPTRLLPRIVQSGTVLGRTLPGVTRAAGLADDVAVVAVGCHDTASAVAAIPHIDARSVFLSNGTWSLMGVEADEPNVSLAAFELGFTNEAGVNGKTLLLKNLTGLWILEECVREWTRGGAALNWDDVVQAAADATPLRCIFDPNHPRLQAPESMVQAVQLCCRELGQDSPQTIGEFGRAVMESLCLTYRHTLESLESLLGRQMETIRVVGGGARNTLFSQMIADACERPVIAGPIEASALGNVLMQAIAAGEIGDLASGRSAIAASIPHVQYEPVPSMAWQDAHARFTRTSCAY